MAFADLDAAAIKIQAVARGKNERRKHRERRVKIKPSIVSEVEKAEEDIAANMAFADLDAAAIKIQAVARGKNERRKNNQRRSKALLCWPQEAKKFKAQREGERSGDLDAVGRYRSKCLRDVCQEKEEGVTEGMIMPWSSSDKVMSVCVCSRVFECACALVRTKPHNIQIKSS
jgi:hypothetical protein